MLTYVAMFLLLSASSALGTQEIICSNSICLPADYNKMDLPGEKRPIQIDTQFHLQVGVGHFLSMTTIFERFPDIFR